MLKTLANMMAGAAITSLVWALVLTPMETKRVAATSPSLSPTEATRGLPPGPPKLDPYAWHYGCVRGMLSMASDMRDSPTTFDDDKRKILRDASDYWTEDVDLLCDGTMDEERDNIQNETGFQGEMYCRASCFEAGRKKVKEIHIDETGTHCICKEN